MIHQVTEDVSISVEVFYQPAQSNPLINEYLFAYRITIENQGEQPMRLLRRHWHIYDSNGSYREVEGEGVIGQKPILQPGASFQYTSACQLRSEMGKMLGTYTLENLYDKRMLLAYIPEFDLIAPQKLN